MDSISFSCDAFAGFGHTVGMARLEPGGLRLQFQTRDAMFGVLRSGTKDVLASFDAIVSVRYGRGFLWLAPWIEVRVADFATLAEIPASEGGRLKLRVKLSDRHDAQVLIEQLRQRLAERRFDRLQGELDRMSSALPPTLFEPPPLPPAAARQPATRPPGQLE